MLRRQRWTRLAMVHAVLGALIPRPALADWPSDPLVNLPVCTAANQQNGPAIVSDGAGGAIIAWFDARPGVTHDIYAQRVLANGTVDPAWPANGRAICDTTGDQTLLAITTDGGSGAIIAWQDARGASGFDIYAQHVLAGGTLDPAWPRQGRALCTAPNDQLNPVAIADGGGGAIVAWQDRRNGTSVDDIFAQRVLATGALDPGWPVDGRALCVAGGVQEFPGIVASAAGGAIVTWEDQRAGAGADDIYAQHLLGTGAIDAAWPSDGLALCTAVGAQSQPSIIGDGGPLGGVGSGAIVVWTDARAGTTNKDVYAQHVLAAGAVDSRWPVNGRALCTAVGNQGPAKLTADGAHGAIVAWSDQRFGTTSGDIFAQRVRADGAVDPAWPGDGLALCTAAFTQASVAIDGDGAGGAIVTWMDNRLTGTSDFDIYAAHVLPGGSADPAWPANGSALSTVAGVQSSPRLIADGAGGAIVTWVDLRIGSQNGDIFAQRVHANGSLGGTVDVPREAVSGLSLSAIRPNPWRGGVLTLEFSLPSDASAIVEVLDIAGRRVARQVLAGGASGRGTAKVQLPNRLAPGVYLARVLQGGERTRRFVVLE